jgi:hypothetical protein
MWSVFRRVALPALLVIAGAGALVEGVRFHQIPVLVKTKKQVTVEEPPKQEAIEEPPPMPPWPPMGDAGSPDGEPLRAFPAFAKPAAPVKKTETREVNKTIFISEPDLTRDTTVDGVVLLASGDLMRTYGGGDGSGGGSKGPAKCPT